MLLPLGMSAETVPRAAPHQRALHAHRLQIEAAFAVGFADMVGRVNFSDVAQPYAGQRLPGAHRLGRFSLAPLTRSDYHETPDSKRPTWPGDLVVPADVQLPQNSTSAIGMDTSFGIAMVFDDTLMAMSDAHVPEAWEGEAEVMIRNMQGYANRPGGRRLPRNEDGFYSGIDWRKTFVHAWGVVAKQAGARTIGIQAASQNAWAGKLGLKLADANPPEGHPYLPVAAYRALGAQVMHAGYDVVAQDLGFIEMLAGHWENALPIGSMAFPAPIRPDTS